MTENWHRRRSEAELARLNIELEHRVRARTAELEAVIENSRDAIWSVDRRATVRVMNAATHRRLAHRHGAPTTPAIRRGPCPAERASAVPRALRPRLRRRARAARAQRRRRRTGIEYFVISVHPIVEDGEVVGATIFSSDITDRKRAEEQARQHQAELAHVLRLSTMGEMAAGPGARDQPAARRDRQLRPGLPCAACAPAARSTTPALLPVVERSAPRRCAPARSSGACASCCARRSRSRSRSTSTPGARRRRRASSRPRRCASGVGVELELAADAAAGARAIAIQLEQVLLNLLLNGDRGERGRDERQAPAASSCARRPTPASVEVAVTRRRRRPAAAARRRLRAVLHHQAARPRHGPVDQPLDRRAARRPPRRAAQPGPRQHLPPHPARRADGRRPRWRSDRARARVAAADRGDRHRRTVAVSHPRRQRRAGRDRTHGQRAARSQRPHDPRMGSVARRSPERRDLRGGGRRRRHASVVERRHRRGDRSARRRRRVRSRSSPVRRCSSSSDPTAAPMGCGGATARRPAPDPFRCRAFPTPIPSRSACSATGSSVEQLRRRLPRLCGSPMAAPTAPIGSATPRSRAAVPRTSSRSARGCCSPPTATADASCGRPTAPRPAPRRSSTSRRAPPARSSSVARN